MPADHAEVLARFRTHIASKSAHGRAELLEVLARLEGECTVPPDTYRRVLSRFGEELEAAFLNVLGSADPPSVPDRMTGPAVVKDPPSMAADGGTEVQQCSTQKTSGQTGRQRALARS